MATSASTRAEIPTGTPLLLSLKNASAAGRVARDIRQGMSFSNHPPHATGYTHAIRNNHCEIKDLRAKIRKSDCRISLPETLRMNTVLQENEST